MSPRLPLLAIEPLALGVGNWRLTLGDATARRRGKSKRLFEVTPLGLRTARELHRVREKIWSTIAEGRRS